MLGGQSAWPACKRPAAQVPAPAKDTHHDRAHGPSCKIHSPCPRASLPVGLIAGPRHAASNDVSQLSLQAGVALPPSSSQRESRALPLALPQAEGSRDAQQPATLLPMVTGDRDTFFKLLCFGVSFLEQPGNQPKESALASEMKFPENSSF